jgi:hypothetical protein
MRANPRHQIQTQCGCDLRHETPLSLEAHENADMLKAR